MFLQEVETAEVEERQEPELERIINEG